MENTFPSDPIKFFGPGIWFCIHTLAKRCTTLEDMNKFIDFMKLISETLPCMDCRLHCVEFMRDHDLEYFKDVTDKYGDHTGMVKWAWMFHNSVNLRLGKPIIDQETAYNMYDVDDSLVCREGCGSP